MKVLTLCLAAAVLSALLAGGQQSERIPVGIEKARKVRTQPTVPPQFKPLPAWRRADPARLEREADELAKLAQLIPSQVEQVKTGRLPKDLNEQLKRIEKLSKQLRRELSP